MELTTYDPPSMPVVPNLNGHTPTLAPTSPVRSALPQPAVRPDPPAADLPTPKPKRRSRRKLQNFLTASGALMAMIASGTGMWKFFGVQLHIDNLYFRGVMFGVFEVLLLAFALRARQHYIDTGRNGKDAITVWVMASATGALAAMDETSWPARVARLALPLAAAYGFEAAFHAERDDAEKAKGHERRQVINWRISPSRIFVALGLADASQRDVADIDLTKRMARLATLAYRAHSPRWFWGSQDRAQGRYQKALAKANERFGLATNPKAMEQFRASVALLNGAITSTSADAVETASPWSRATLREERELQRPRGQTRGTSTTSARTNTDTTARSSKTDRAVAGWWTRARTTFYARDYARSLDETGREIGGADLDAGLGLKGASARRARDQKLRTRYVQEVAEGARSPRVQLPDEIAQALADRAATARSGDEEGARS